MKAKIIVKSIIFNFSFGKILLMQRSKTDLVGANTWEGEGGNIEAGETLEEAIRREIREETKITEVEIGRIAYVTLVDGDNPYLIVAYFCEVSTENVSLSDEHQAFMWASKEECRRILPAAIIEDFEKTIDLNVNAVFVCSKVAAKYMKEQDIHIHLFHPQGSPFQ